MEPSPAQSLIDRWTQWLATDAPRRLAPAIIQEYQWQLVAFARWMETMLNVSFAPESITAYRMEQYVTTLEAQVRSKAANPQRSTKRSPPCPRSAPGWSKKAPVPTRPPGASAPWASRCVQWPVCRES